MRFYEDLAVRLDEADVLLAQAAPRPLPPPRRRWLRAPLLAGAAVAAAVFVLVTSVFDGDQTGLPIFETPTADASPVRSALSPTVAAVAQFDEARKFDTPNGEGFVFPTDDGQICLAIPDSVPDSFGATCRSRAVAQRDGLSGALQTEAGSGKPGLAVVVLPTDEREIEAVGADARRVGLSARGGVVVWQPAFDAELRWKGTDARSQSVTVRKELPQGAELVQCSDGTYGRRQPGQTKEEVC